MSDPDGYEGWAIVELMGHRVVYGFAREVEMLGTKLLRVEIPTPVPTVQHYGGAAIYCITATTEERCRAANTPRALPAAEAFCSDCGCLVTACECPVDAERPGPLDEDDEEVPL